MKAAAMVRCGYYRAAAAQHSLVRTCSPSGSSAVHLPIHTYRCTGTGAHLYGSSMSMLFQRHYSRTVSGLEVSKKSSHSLANDQYNLTMPLRDPNIHWCVLNDIRQRILNKPYDSGATPKNARAIRDAFAEMEDIIDEYVQITSRGGAEAGTGESGSKQSTRLEKLLPEFRRYAHFFTTLPLRLAYEEYNRKTSFSMRRHVEPSIDEIRAIFNLAQCRQIANQLQLVTFDGDETLYRDGGNMGDDSPLVDPILALLSRGVHVALVTAVGHNSPAPYEERLKGLLNGMVRQRLPVEARQKLLVMGGQCNYLFQYCPESKQSNPMLSQVPREEWCTEEVMQWPDETMADMLDVAQATLEDRAETFQLPVRVVRKERAVGAVFLDKPTPTTHLFLDELALEVRAEIKKQWPDDREDIRESDFLEKNEQAKKEQCNNIQKENCSSFVPSSNSGKQRRNGLLPFCTFNGGQDVFFDIGNKQIGIQCLRKKLGVKGEESLHFGDQFTRTGNDLLARRVCATIWVKGPRETLAYLNTLLADSELQPI